MLFKATVISPFLAVIVSAGPTSLALEERSTSDDNLVTFCFSEDSCFQASSIPDGCSDLPLFGDDFQTASLSASGIQCSLFVDRECLGASGIISQDGATVQLGTLGLSTVASFVCYGPEDDLITFCPSEGICGLASAIPNGCVDLDLPVLNGQPVANVTLSAPGFECNLFQDLACSGKTVVVSQSASSGVELSTLGLSNTLSMSCISNTNLLSLCFADANTECFYTSSSVNTNECENLPNFIDAVETASLTTQFEIRCRLFEDSNCSGASGLIDEPGVISLDTLGLTTVASINCNEPGDDDIVTFCSADGVCFDSETNIDGCTGFPEFSFSFATATLGEFVDSGTNCTLFQDPNCQGSSGVVDVPGVTVNLDVFGMTTVTSLSCVKK
ncbi:hypothetical protein MVEN_00690900 [Mycena venus]|uniref:Uncharacterized protein n=1 Tax=Mycena venus TaxID=2733690 RepID=A0A8H7D5L3_9AGAR|nr:hypothetical protein MVEN_00690900 [Mycena venus]